MIFNPKNITIKIIALTVCACFLWQDVVWAADSDFLRQRQFFEEIQPAKGSAIGIDGKDYPPAAVNQANIEDSRERIKELMSRIALHVQERGVGIVEGEEAVAEARWLLEQMIELTNCSDELFSANMPAHMRDMFLLIKMLTDNPSAWLLIAGRLHDADRFFDGKYIMIKHEMLQGKEAFNNYIKPIQHPGLAADFIKSLLEALGIDEKIVGKVDILVRNHETGIDTKRTPKPQVLTDEEWQALVADSKILQGADSISFFTPELQINNLLDLRRKGRGEPDQKVEIWQKYYRASRKSRKVIDALMAQRGKIYMATEDGEICYEIFRKVRAEANIFELIEGACGPNQAENERFINTLLFRLLLKNIKPEDRVEAVESFIERLIESKLIADGDYGKIIKEIKNQAEQDILDREKIKRSPLKKLLRGGKPDDVSSAEAAGIKGIVYKIFAPERRKGEFDLYDLSRIAITLLLGWFMFTLIAGWYNPSTAELVGTQTVLLWNFLILIRTILSEWLPTWFVNLKSTVKLKWSLKKMDWQKTTGMAMHSAWSLLMFAASLYVTVLVINLLTSYMDIGQSGKYVIKGVILGVMNGAYDGFIMRRCMKDPSATTGGEFGSNFAMYFGATSIAGVAETIVPGLHISDNVLAIIAKIIGETCKGFLDTFRRKQEIKEELELAADTTGAMQPDSNSSTDADATGQLTQVSEGVYEKVAANTGNTTTITAGDASRVSATEADAGGIDEARVEDAEEITRPAINNASGRAMKIKKGSIVLRHRAIMAALVIAQMRMRRMALIEMTLLTAMTREERDQRELITATSSLAESL